MKRRGGRVAGTQGGREAGWMCDTSVERLGDEFDGTKWAGGLVFDGTKWAGGLVFDGTKWAGGLVSLGWWSLTLVPWPSTSASRESGYSLPHP